jgi:hypothetical protein
VNSLISHPRLVLAAFIGTLVCGNAHAQILNGNFNSGLTSWTSVGDAGIVSGAARVTTASSEFEDDFPATAGAFNISGTSAALGGGALEFAVGLSATGLDLSVSNTAFEGSAITQTFNVTAGDTLSFNYNFLTNEGTFLDYAFYTVNGTKFNLAQVANATSASSSFAFETGLLTASHVFTTTGAVTLSFGVVDIGDFGVTSALDLDNVTVVTAIPEPSTYAALQAVGIFAVVAVRRRRAV